MTMIGVLFWGCGGSSSSSTTSGNYEAPTALAIAPDPTDTSRSALYVVNDDTGTLSVVDLDEGGPLSISNNPLSLSLTDVETTPRVRDIVLTPDGSRLFAVMLQEDSGHLRGVEVTSSSIDRVDLDATDDDSATALDLGGTPEAIELSADGTLAYVLLSNAPSLLEIDLSDFTIQQTISLDRSETTEQTTVPVAFTLTDGDFPAYVVDRGGADELIRVVKNEDGTFTVDALTLPRKGSAIALLSSQHRVFIPDAGTGNITVVDVEAFAIDEESLPPLNPGGIPKGIAIGPATIDLGEGAFTPGLVVDREGKVFLLNADTPALVDLDSETDDVDGFGVGVFPTEVVFSSDAATAYVTNSGSNSISVLDLTNLEVSATLE